MKTRSQIKGNYISGMYELARMNGQIFDRPKAEREFDEFITELREQAVRDHHATQAESMGYRLWNQGFSAGMAEWLKQRKDPTHPITRNNPYRRFQ